MAPPTYFQIKYWINPWMNGIKVNRPRAFKQWQGLKTLCQNQAGLRVETLKPVPDLPDFAFTADQGLVVNNVFLKSSFRFPQRRKEARFAASYFKQKGIPVLELPSRAFFEGRGDSLFYQDKLLAGFGFRSNQQAHQLISQSLSIEVVSLKLVDPRFYHLDTALCILGSQNALYFPQAFSLQSRARLQRLIPNLIPVSKQDAKDFACNSLVFNHKIIMGLGSLKTKAKLKSLGYQIFETDLSEFKKSGGGAHCLAGGY